MRGGRRARGKRINEVPRRLKVSSKFERSMFVKGSWFSKSFNDQNLVSSLWNCFHADSAPKAQHASSYASVVARLFA